jgi:hypothetical protein
MLLTVKKEGNQGQREQIRALIMHLIINDSRRTPILKSMPCDILDQHLINIYFSNMDSLGISGTVNCYLKIPEMCLCFEICCPKCSL